MENQNPVDCFKCRHFHVTWDHSYPRGCRALGFKGKEIPSLAVLRASGMPCLHFENKNSKHRKEGLKNNE